MLRFDNRDVGLSTHFGDAPVGEAGECYRLGDMAADAIAVLDAAGVQRAHVIGLSMGGMIVQTMAIEHPERLLTMTSVMSTTGEPGYGASSPEAYAAADRAAGHRPRLGHRARRRRAADLGQPRLRRRGAVGRRRRPRLRPLLRPGRGARQFLAVGASGSRADGLRGVRTPTLVLHGDQDTLIDQSGGRRTAELVPGARFELIEGMGHDYPPQLWPRWVELVTDHIAAHS